MKTNVIKLNERRRETAPNRKDEVFQEVANLVSELGWSAIGHASDNPQFLIIGNYSMIQEILDRIRNPSSKWEEDRGGEGASNPYR